MGNISKAYLTESPEVGDSVGRPVQSVSVDAIFGKPYQIGSKTIIPIAQTRRIILGHEGAGVGMSRSGRGGVFSGARPVALLAIENGEAKIVPIRNPMPIILIGMLVGAWNFYWLMRTVREWRRSSA